MLGGAVGRGAVARTHILHAGVGLHDVFLHLVSIFLQALYELGQLFAGDAGEEEERERSSSPRGGLLSAHRGPATWPGASRARPALQLRVTHCCLSNTFQNTPKRRAARRGAVAGAFPARQQWERCRCQARPSLGTRSRRAARGAGLSYTPTPLALPQHPQPLCMAFALPSTRTERSACSSPASLRRHLLCKEVHRIYTK